MLPDKSGILIDINPEEEIETMGQEEFMKEAWDGWTEEPPSEMGMEPCNVCGIAEFPEEMNMWGVCEDCQATG